jgi:poly(3-hydroxybutyrate) depolymerase
VLATLALAGLAQTANAEVLSKTKKIKGATVEYRVILPNGYDASKAYPGVLAFGGGGQDLRIVERTVERTWKKYAESLGYIVVIPAAPNGDLFFEGGERIFPEFIDQFLSEYKILNNKLHIAGQSNGGISAFHVAALYPKYFLSITGLPGYLPNDNATRLKNISKMCIDMYVGELDSGWREDMKAQSDKFAGMGMKVHFSVEKGQEHLINTLAGDGAKRIFDRLEEARKTCGGN